MNIYTEHAKFDKKEKKKKRKKVFKYPITSAS